MTDDLAPVELGALLADRPLRSYPALLSTEAEAMAWARAGAVAGAVVVADYQAAPRGRGGWPWQVQPGRDLGFSLVLRPDLPAEREGWLYVAASLGVADALAGAAAAGGLRFEWPDTVADGQGTVAARLGVFTHLADGRTQWTVLTMLVPEVARPRGLLLARLVAGVEARLDAASAVVLDAYRARCTTLGRQVRARLVPLGSAGQVIEGLAVDVLADGALVLRTARGNRVAVRAPHLGVLEPVG